MASLRTLPSLLGHRIINKALIDVTKLPASYTSNSPKEEHLLQVADNFSRQYSHLCPDRVPLFLHPLNECNVPVSLGLGGRGQSRSRGNGGRHTQLSLWSSAGLWGAGGDDSRGTRVWGLNWKRGYHPVTELHPQASS